MSEALNHSLEQTVVNEPAWLQVVATQVHGLQFGTVLITVHEGRVVQVERTEKLRLDREAKSAAGRSDRLAKI